MKPYRRKVIGEIDGSPVQGQYYDEDGEPSVVVITWKGWQIESDGVWLRLPTSGHEVGHMSVADWQRIKELAQANVIDRLIEMGREWVKTPPIEPAEDDE